MEKLTAAWTSIVGLVQSFLHLVRYNTASADLTSISIVVEEFFHEDLRGFGGFGKTAQNLSSHFNSLHNYSAYVNLTTDIRTLPASTVREYHDTSVLLKSPRKTSLNTLVTEKLEQAFSTDLYLTIDYYPSYNRTLLRNSSTPIMVYIRDPRSRVEWKKIGSVPLELKERNRDSLDHLLRYADEKAEAIQEVIQQSEAIGRPIFFATAGKFLRERASRTYGLDVTDADLLYNAIPVRPWNGIKTTDKPSICYLGRLDAVKRFWIVLELAKRFPEIDFHMCGKSTNPNLVQPIISEYEHLDNVHFEGLVTGEKKQKLLTESWALLNTSVHEGYPVSFQESFAYGTPVISCQNPDNVVDDFGYYTGEILGKGMDDDSIESFVSQIKLLLDDRDAAHEKGHQARAFVEEHHTFEAFDAKFEDILDRQLRMQPA